MALEKDGTCPSPDCADWETLVYVFPTDPEAQQKIEWDAGICRCGTLQFDSTQGQPPIDDTCPGSCPSKNNNAIYLLCYDGGHGKPDKDRCYCVCLPDHDVDKP